MTAIPPALFVPIRLSVARTVEVDVLPIDLVGAMPDAMLRAECIRRGLMSEDTAVVSGAHIRAARGLLDWSLERLAARSGVSMSTIRRLEEGGAEHTRPANVAAVQGALARGGVQFRSLEGVTCVLLAAPAPAGAEAARELAA